MKKKRYSKYLMWFSVNIWKCKIEVVKLKEVEVEEISW